MQSQIKTILISVSLLAVLFFTAFCQPGKPSAGGEKGLNVARYRVAVRSEANDSSKVITVIQGGESVEVTEVKEVKNGAKEVKYSKVKLSDGTVGFVRASHLAIGSLVILRDDVKLYQRNNISSARARGAENLDVGTPASILKEAEDGKWIQVSGGSRDSYFKGWLETGDNISRDKGIIAAAFRLQRAASTIKNPAAKESELEEARNLLENLVNENQEPISSLASNYLAQINAGLSGEVGDETGAAEEGNGEAEGGATEGEEQ